MIFMQNLSSTMEDYLLAAYSLEREKRVARPRDIGLRLKVAKSTVTSALQNLAGKGLINYEPYEAVTLTEPGRREAEALIVRNMALRDFLENILGLPPVEAGPTACGMEHALKPETVRRFICFMALLKERIGGDSSWGLNFHDCVKKGIEVELAGELVGKYLTALRENERANG